MQASDPSAGTDDQPVLPWRWVAGGLLHFAVGAYVLIVPLLCLLLAPKGADAEAIARLAIGSSLAFLAVLAVGALVLLPAAKLIDRTVRTRRRRRPSAGASAAAALSYRRVERATGVSLDNDAASILGRIAAARRHHDDPAYRALARDLDEVVRASAAALASAMRERRPAIVARTVQALTRISEELNTLAASKARLDEAKVDLLANYLDARYPASDSSLKAD